MENIETLLAAVAQTQGFDDDEPAVCAPQELGLRNPGSAAATQLFAGDARPSLAVETAVPAPTSAFPALGRVIFVGEKRKRGRPPKTQLAAYPPPPVRKKVEDDEEEDVCFICFDGGSLVLCDRKGCPKAYHPACIKRDEAFFQAKARWNCGWHICSVCEKASYHMCYTCTYSLCKACTKNEDFMRVRGNKGFCSTCIKPIMLIENKDQAIDGSIIVDFDDKLSWEYLFKMYWLLLKDKLSLTLSELTQAIKPCLGVARNPQFSNVLPIAYGGEASVSCRSAENLELNKSHVDINLIQNDGLRISSNGYHAEKLHIDQGENLLSYNKDTVKPNMDKVIDQISTAEATGNPFIQKDLDDLSSIKDTIKPCISKNMDTVGSKKQAIDRTVWASKDLLDFVAHMKSGDTSNMSQFDVQTLLLDYIKRNNLRDPQQKSQIICDQRLTNLFGKPRVGHIEMLKLLEFHFLIKEDSQKSSFIPAAFVSSMANDVDRDGSVLRLARKTRKKSEDRVLQHDLHEYAAIDVHNIHLIYLRRNLMVNLMDDCENFNNKVVGSIVRIRLPIIDQKPEAHRLVQVVGTSKAAMTYKVGNRTADVMLEVSDLDRKEVVSIDIISNQEFTEEECRRLRQSIRCGLVKHFTIGEVQKKAVALQSVRVNDWLEAEVSKLNHLRDRASEMGHKKELREYVDRLQLLASPEERKRRLSEVAEIHADPKMSPNYESEEDSRSWGNGTKDKNVRSSYSRFPRNGRKTCSNKKGKEDRSTDMKNRMIGKAYSSRSNSLDKQMNQINIGTSPNGGRNDHSMPRSGLETSTAATFLRNSPSADNIETEKLWHYRDPSSKIQGPFSMMQLRKWSTTGLFPPDMRIWTNHEQYDSLHLTAALTGKFHTASDLSHAPSSGSQSNKPTEGVGVREVSNGTSRNIKQTEATKVVKVDESGWPHCWDLLKDSNSSVADVADVEACTLPFPSIAQTKHVDVNNRCQEGGHFNRRAQTGENNSASLTQSFMTSGAELQGQSNNEDLANMLGLPSPTLKTEKQLSVSADIHAQNLGVLELLSPTPRSDNEHQEAQATETKQPEFMNLSMPDSGPCWNVKVPLPEVTNEWCGYSCTPAIPYFQERNPGLASSSPTKPPEVKIEVIDTSAPDDYHVAHDSTSHPVSNKPNWLTIMNEPIEFLSLGEDSVSDLLAEVDAMEFQGPLPSPTSALKFARELLEDCKDGCFSSIEGFSSVSEPRASDALSSTSDVHLMSQCSATCKPNGTSLVDAFDFFRRSSANSSASSEGETNAPVHSSDAGSEHHAPAPSNTNQEDIIGTGSDPTDPGWGTLQGNINLVTVQGNVNLVLGAPAQGMTNLGWGTNPGHAWANPSTNRSPRNGSLPWDSQRKYGGERFNSPREWGYQGGDSGFGRGRPWRRQPYGGGGGGGYSRALPKGQRVCKFYEGGHCKKGAFCDYLHP